MKRYILLGLAAITFGLFGLNMAFAHNEGDDYWYDEYWQDDPYYHHHHHYDHHWVYYPHGYYCAYYVWYYPWWWDWYWYRAHWCHHWDWHFFGAGYYIVWYEGSHWYWRPRYGRYVRYELPYGYNDFRYKAREYGVNLPDKPPRQIDVPYKEKEIQRLTRERDPELYKRLEKEQKSGNLEKMRKDFEVKQRKEIEVKNQEYRVSKNKVQLEEKSFVEKRNDRAIDRESDTGRNLEKRAYNEDTDNRSKKPNVEKRDWSEYYEDKEDNGNSDRDNSRYNKPENRDSDNSDRNKENDKDKNNNNNNRNRVPEKNNDRNANDGSARERTNTDLRSRR